jgi:hypothetical protein
MAILYVDLEIIRKKNYLAFSAQRKAATKYKAIHYNSFRGACV